MRGRAGRYILRSAEAEHDTFLYRLFVAQHALALPWGEDHAQLNQLIALQFRARNAAYAANYPGAASDLICTPELALMGRLLVAENAQGVHLVDIALLPEHRRQGVGTRILRDLQRSAAEKGRRITLHVQRDSPARYLYRRLGFQTVGEDAMYLQMVWAAQGT